MEIGVPVDMRAIFDRQHALSRDGTVAPLALRRDRLARLRALVLEEKSAIAHAISDDFGGRSRDETEFLEIMPLLESLRFTARHVERWMRPERRAVDIVFKPARARVRYEPLGVVGIMSPWNYPLLLSLSPVVDAFAAGNRVMAKPSEYTPGLADLLRRLVAARFDASEFAVVTGGVEVATSFAALPFDHLVFTGSTATGRKVAVAAAANLTPVTMELGGKSPAIVAPDYPLEKAARSIALGKFVNAGQTCIAPDYVLAPAASVRPLAEAILARARRTYPTLADNLAYSAIIDQRRYDRLAGMVEDARSRGATVLAHDDPAARQLQKFPPTIVLDPPETGPLMEEEIFGPVLPIVGYQTLADATAYVRARPRPLALYAFSDSRQTQEAILDAAPSGGVTLNGTLFHIAQHSLPFGGVGPSGMGAYHGHDGFKRLSHARGVMETGPVNIPERLGPPYGRLAYWIAGIIARRR
jgi:coniferyl-aldehyde dehydrogenase